MNNVDLNYVATMIENLRHGDDAYYTPETIDSIIAALREQTAPAGTDGGECQHEWVPDVDVSGWVYCHRCDCSRRDPSLRPKAIPAGATVEERWDVTSLLRITKTAIEVCNELSRPAMAEDLESVQHYLASCLAQQPSAIAEELVVFTPEAVFDEESAWNAERERLESIALSAAEKLLDHSNAAGITLARRGFEVSITFVADTGVKS